MRIPSLAIAFCVFLWSTSDAWAIRTITLQPKLEVTVAVNPKRIVHMHFPMDVIQASCGNTEEFTVKKPRTFEVTVQPHVFDNTNMLIILPRHRVVVNVVATEAKKVETLIDFVLPEPTTTSPHTKDDARRLPLLHKLHEEDMGETRQQEWRSTKGHHLQATLSNVIDGKRYVSFVAIVRNAGNKDLPLAKIEVRDLDTGDDHLVEFVVDSEEHTLPDRLERGQELRIAVLAENAALNNGWDLGLIPTIGLGPALFKWRDSGYVPPLGRERLTLGISATGGVAQYTHDNDSQFAMSRSIGLRAKYGVTKLFAIEALVGYLETGEVAFDDGTAAHLAGAQLFVNGVLTLGDQFAPFARLGGGVIPAKIRDADGSRFQLFPAIALGVGLDAWIKKSLLLGVSLDGIVGSDLPFTVAASVHLSYAWRLSHYY